MQDRTHSFGYWLRRRRKALDLTQEALAQRVSCSVFSIRKVESDERRPSRRLAERLAACLAIPEHERLEFLDAARALQRTDRLPLDMRPAQDAGPDAATAARPAASSEPPAESTSFVGRGPEYGLLVERLARLAQGGGGSVLIEGEPGIGKSRLLRETLRHAQAQGITTLMTKCYEIERAMPYQPVMDLVARTLDRLPTASLGRMAPVSLAELAELVPEIGERCPGLPRLSTDFPEARQARLSRAVGHLLETLGAGGAALLIVDDLQWADDASAQLFHYLARQASERPLLAVYAYRDEDAGSDERLASMLESLQREAGARRLPLPRLQSADTARLVAELGGGDAATSALAERLHRDTEGNPFFLVSMLHSLSEGPSPQSLRSDADAPGLLPDALRAAVRVRLAHVPKDVRPLLDLAAVLGRRFDFDTLVELTHDTEERLLAALDVLLRRRLLREDPAEGVFDFSHDKVREVVYRDIGAARRRLLHQAVAEALERRGDAATHERDARLAEHFEQAHVWPKALRYLVRAGERSQALFAMRDALHWLDRAAALAEAHPDVLQDGQWLELLARRGAARAQAGQTQAAVADIRRVVDALRAAGQRGKMRDALVQLGMAYRRADAYEPATACLAEALAESRAMHDEHHAADTLYHLGTVAWSSGLNDQAIVHHQQAVEICERAHFTDLVAVQAYHGRGEAYFANAQPRRAIDCYNRSLALARGIGDRSYETENLMMIGHACLGTKGLGDYALATSHFEAALAIARAADLQWHMGPTLLGLDHARACTGRYGEAWAGMQDSLRSLQNLGQARYQLIAYDLIGHLLLDLGLNRQVIDRLEPGLALGRDTGIRFWGAAIAAHVAVARARLGEHEGAAGLRAALEATRRCSEQYLMVGCLDALAEIALREGDALRCLGHADELLATARANGLREMEAVARRWRGEALLLRGDLPQAQAELTAAAALVQDIGRVRLQLDLQTALERLGEARADAAAARSHRAQAGVLAKAIADSLAGSELEDLARAC